MEPLKNRSKIKQVSLCKSLKKLHTLTSLAAKTTAEVMPIEHLEYKRMNKLKDK